MIDRYRIKTKSNFNGEIDILGSKSITNRALILAVLSENPVVLKNPLFSDDTIYMIKALRKLGNIIKISDDKKIIKITGNRERIFNDGEIFVGNAGTAMRFLTSYVALGHGKIVLAGNERMNNRPIKELVDALKNLGVQINYLQKEGYPPIEIIADGIKNLDHDKKGNSYKEFENKKREIKISGKNSSQYLSSILMVSPYIEGGVKIILDSEIISKPYVNMTIKMIKKFGASIKKKETKQKESFYEVEERKYNDIVEYTIEGDMSSASYFLALSLITNSTIKINNFILDSLQGDIKILEILKNLGLKVIEVGKDYIVVRGCEKYSGFNLDLNDTPDIVPTLAMVALFASSPTTIRNVESLRVKECDRIKAICNEVKKLNGEIIEYQDGFKIIPKNSNEYNGNEIETYDDHRIAMSFSIAGFRIEGIEILDPFCVSKTFPTFYEELEKIYNCDGFDFGGNCENE